LAFPPIKQTEPVRLQRSQELKAVSLPKSPRGKTTAPLQGAKPAGRSAPGPVGQRTSGHERCKSASGSANKRRSLARVCSQCSTLKNSRSTGYLLFHAPDRNPEGQDHRLGSRQRIEQVAVRQHVRLLACNDFAIPCTTNYRSSEFIFASYRQSY
jgi:hypothetical protein